MKEGQTISIIWRSDDYSHHFAAKKEIEMEAHESIYLREPPAPSINLYKCLQAFTTEEQLGPDDPWYCGDCKELRQAFKKFDIWEAPPILIIHLKRFSYRGNFREKIDDLIDFPLEGLDLGEYVIGPRTVPPIYDLYAVSNHYGSMMGGHYTAYGKHRNDSKWFYFDDQNVTESYPDKVRSNAAYVLFYRRRDVTWTPHVSTEEPSKDSSTEEEESDSDSSPVRYASPPPSSSGVTNTLGSRSVHVHDDSDDDHHHSSDHLDDSSDLENAPRAHSD
uniref:ubiquitinyl hydrolase 1 n=1 Tax=Arcella intermedia TaxID=1963864 RepID=A0A6B2LD86_9EUKA